MDRCMHGVGRGETCYACIKDDKKSRIHAAKEKVVEAAVRWANRPSYESDDRLMLVVRELEEVSRG